MTNRINLDAWLVEYDIPAMAGQPDMTAGQAPATQPGSVGDPMAQNPNPMPPQGSEPTPPQTPQDINQDPQFPEMPNGEEAPQDFDNWQAEYMKQSVKGDPKILEDMILKIRDKDLEPHQEKFVYDNFQICSLRRHPDSVIFRTSQKIRKMIKSQLDKTAPGTSIINYIYHTINEDPLLNQIYLKLTNCGGGKQDYHRKFIAALLGAVQVGSGIENEDLIYNDTDFSIPISTRFNTKWGEVNLVKWSLKEDDVKSKVLSEPEQERMQSGSPEERDVLRRRVIVESIASKFKERAFIINCVGTDGTVQHLGLDLGNCLSAGYLEGKLVIKTTTDDVQEVFIDEEGSTIPVPNIDIYYVKVGGNLNDMGEPDKEEIRFISHRSGNLYLTAQLDVIKEAATNLQGVAYQEAPWQGNPSDLKTIMRCVPNITEILLKNC